MNKDDFWSVDKLLPRVRSLGKDVSLPGASLSDLSISHADPAARFGNRIYREDSRVICHFALRNENTRFSFPDLADAPENASFIPCELFSPSYLSLHEDQRKWFSRFIALTKQRIKTETSFAYIKLAICYCLSRAQKSEIPELFFTLWDLYRSDFPAAEKLFCDVYCDWCFYQRISPDFSRITSTLCRGVTPVQPFLYQLFLFDFLFADGKKLTKEESEFVLRNTTSLSFRKSRAYRLNSQYSALCESALEKALSEGIFNRKETNACLFDLQIPAELRSIRPLFSDLPKQHTPQAEICLVYVPLLGNDVIRDRCDAVVRYIDNRIRAILRLKNRLNLVAITPAHKAFLDGILESYEQFAPPCKASSPVLEETPDPPRTLRFDPKEANEIESDSWAITQKLTEIYENQGEMVTLGDTADDAFDRKYEKELTELESRDQSRASSENPFLEFAATLSRQEDQFISVALYDGAEKARSYAKANGLFFDALVASCNGKAVETTGDAVLAPTGNVFEDYVSDMKEVFLPNDGGQRNA